MSAGGYTCGTAVGIRLKATEKKREPALHDSSEKRGLHMLAAQQSTNTLPVFFLGSYLSAARNSDCEAQRSKTVHRDIDILCWAFFFSGDVVETSYRNVLRGIFYH